MSESQFDEVLRVVVQTTGLLIFSFLIIRPLVQEKVRESKERIKRLDGRKEE